MVSGSVAHSLSAITPVAGLVRYAEQKGTRVVAMNNKPTTGKRDVTYYCQDPICPVPGGAEFKAPQGSRQRFCDACIGRRQRESWKKRKPKEKGNGNN